MCTARSAAAQDLAHLVGDLHTFVWCLVLSGAERFAIASLRVNEGWLLGFTAPQWFAVASLLVGTALLFVLRARAPQRQPLAVH